MRQTFLLGLAFAVMFLLPAAGAGADGCSASKTCSDGSVISCTGNDTCTVGSDYVECDGKATACPPAQSCTAQYDCPYPEYSEPFILYCSSPTGPCSVSTWSDSITCGSTTMSCSGCEQGLYPCMTRPIGP